MQYLSPGRSSSLHPKLEPKSFNTVSLPVLNRPQREKIEQLLSVDREKVKQKLKENYFNKDISHLKDRLSTQGAQENFPETLPSGLKDIISLAFGSCDKKTENTLTKLIGKKSGEVKEKKTLPGTLRTVSETPLPSLTPTPTGRQDALNLKLWLDATEAQYLNPLSELSLNVGIADKEPIHRAWKAIYVLAFKELIRQVTVQCYERGILLQRILCGYEKVVESFTSKFQADLKKAKKEFNNRIQEFSLTFSEQLGLAQAKIERLEQEKEKWRKNKNEILVKTGELIGYMEKLRKYEDKVKKVKGKASYFDAYVKFVEEMSVANENVLTVNVNEKRNEEAVKNMKELSDLKLEIKRKKQRFDEISAEVNEKECVLASLQFEIEIKEPKLKKRPENKAFITGESPMPIKKNVISTMKNYIEDESVHSERFFRVLMEKSKDRLLSKGKIAQDHLFKSISVIYNRTVTQLNEISGAEVHSFQTLLYRQFIKTDSRKKCEKSLKAFICGCLKFSQFKRASVFLRLLDLGELIEKSSFSQKSFLLYLSIHTFMQSAKIGLLLFKDPSIAIQYYPYSRALACLNDISSIYPAKSIENAEIFLKEHTIPDPRQVNPQGLIDLELFIEYLLEVHEGLIIDIIFNITELFKAVPEEGVSKELFRALMKILADKENNEPFEAVFKAVDSKVDVESAIDIACKLCAATTFKIAGFVEEYKGLDEAEARILIKTKMICESSEISEGLINTISDINITHALVWMKLLETHDQS